MLKKMNILYEEFKNEITSINTSGIGVTERSKNGLVYVGKILGQLQNTVQNNQFESVEEEIQFFKYLKPKFYQWKIYYLEIYSMESCRPVCGKPLIKFYNEQVKFYQSFFDRHGYYYQYYRLKLVEMDSYYFVRGAGLPYLVMPDVHELNSSFSTALDYLFAKFMAYEELLKYVLAEIERLTASKAVAEPEAKSHAPLMKWTGDKTNLVEVIYGLFYTGQLNSGNATVADIIKWMEHHLQIDLSRSYKNFIDIKNRKRDSPTKFLDKMKDFILQRIDEDNRYKPNRGIRLIDDRENK